MKSSLLSTNSVDLIIGFDQFAITMVAVVLHRFRLHRYSVALLYRYPGLVVLKHLKSTLLLDVKMPTIVDILTFISRINTTPESFKAINILFSIYFLGSVELSIKINYNLDSFFKSGLLLHGDCHKHNRLNRVFECSLFRKRIRKIGVTVAECTIE